MDQGLYDDNNHANLGVLTVYSLGLLYVQVGNLYRCEVWNGNVFFHIWDTFGEWDHGPGTTATNDDDPGEIMVKWLAQEQNARSVESLYSRDHQLD